HLARPSPRGHDAGWRAPGRLGSVLVGLLTGGTGGLAGEARKRLRVAGALARWQDGLHWSRLCRSALARPGSRRHQKEPEQSHGPCPYAGWEEAGLTDRVINAMTPRIVRKDSSICPSRQRAANLRANNPCEAADTRACAP